MASKQQTVTVEGRRIRVSNLDKVLYPETGTTKRDVLEYLQGIAPVMLPHCRDRAATRKRWPDGVEGQMFFQKDIGEGAPDWVEVRAIEHRDHVNHYPLVNDLPTLVWLGQLAALEIHVPQWRFGRGTRSSTPIGSCSISILVRASRSGSALKSRPSPGASSPIWGSQRCR